MMEIVRFSGSESDSEFLSIAQIHREEISEGFLSTLGDKFLVVLYRTLAQSEVAFLLVAKEEALVVGFLAGSLDTGRVYKDFMKRAGFQAVLMILPKLLNVARIKRVLETLLYPNKQKEEDLPEPEILNFCVSSEFQGKGVGGKLFREFCTEMKKRGVAKVRIVTGESQKSAQVFYEAKGAVLHKEIEVHEGAKSLVYLYDIE